MPRSDEKLEIEKVRGYISTVEAEINQMSIVPRSVDEMPFESVALAALSKIVALAKASLALLEADYPDEAYGLSRSLVECATNLRYLTEEPKLRDQRTQDFTHYALADKSYWLHHAFEQFAGRPEEDEIRKYAASIGINPETKAANRHWSGVNGFVWTTALGAHPLDNPATSKPSKRMSYAVDYHQTSSFVHCAQPALDNYCPEANKPFRISPSSCEYHKSFQKVLFIIVIYVHSAIYYALFGLGLERPLQLRDQFGKVLEVLAPPQPPPKQDGSCAGDQPR